ncbi:MAG TPA: DUF4190 domain-containing protein [Actinomycetota bacterium]|nr:DUF4190 domain-containing protein [Actinomycetota bacterium]
MRLCPQCRASAEDAARFCKECGRSLPSRVPQPGTGRPLADYFREPGAGAEPGAPEDVAREPEPEPELREPLDPREPDPAPTESSDAPPALDAESAPGVREPAWTGARERSAGEAAAVPAVSAPSPPIVHTRTEPMAITSLVASLANLMCPPVGAIAGIITGFIARSRIRKDPARTGAGLALAGIVLGFLGLALTIGMFAWFVLMQASTFQPNVMVGPGLQAPNLQGPGSPDREAQMSLRRALTSAKTVYTDREDYRTLTEQDLTMADPGMSFIKDGVSQSPNIVSFQIVGKDELRMAVFIPATGMCFAIRDVIGSATTYALKATPDCRPSTFTDSDFGPDPWTGRSTPSPATF